MKKPILVLILILILASLLRIYHLNQAPISLFGDEVDVGYQSYSLLKTGQDLQGNTWPILVHSLSEYRAPLFIYSDIPFVAIFGLNEWGVRLAAAFWGILGILGIYLLTYKLFNQKIGLWAAFFLAISPWHIQYSRAGFEVTMLLTFLIFAAYFFLKGLENKYLLVISSILFALTPYIYSTAVVFMPLLLITLLILHRKKLLKNIPILIISFFVMVLVALPYVQQTLMGNAGERFSIISIFGSQELKDKVLLLQQRNELPFGLQKFFYNKPLIWLQNFSLNYLRAFSPEFLFLNGDPNARQSVHEMGEMYFYEIVLLFLGIWAVVKKNPLILSWLLIAPIPASLTYDGGFHATRDFLMLPPLMIILALGVNSLLENKNKFKIKYLLVTLCILATFNFGFYLHRYYTDYELESSRAWQSGFKQTMQYIAENEKDYDKILINNTYEPSLIRFLFWTKYDPVRLHLEFKGDKPVRNVLSGFDGFVLDKKYYFGKLTIPYENILDSKTLYIASARDDITNPETLKDTRIHLLDTVYSSDHEPIFYIVTGAK